MDIKVRSVYGNKEIVITYGDMTLNTGYLCSIEAADYAAVLRAAADELHPDERLQEALDEIESLENQLLEAGEMESP